MFLFFYQHTSDFIPISAIEDAGYRGTVASRPVRGRSTTFTSRQTSGRAVLVRVTHDQTTPNGRMREGPLPAIYTEGTTTPSGMSMGTDSYFVVRGGQLTLIAITRHEWVQFSMDGPYRNTQEGYREELEHDWTNDQKFAERIVRRSLSMTAGQRVGDLKSRTVAGSSVSSGVCRKSNRVFGDLAAWCAARGWSMTHSDDYDYYTLRKGGKYAVVPLGSAKVKVNGVWKDGVDAVALVGGKWFLTQQALEAIRQGE